MKKRNVLLIALLVVVMSLVIAIPASATVMGGCTPGYWKQEHHFDSWVTYSPGDYYDDVFGVGPHITLLDALWARGGGEYAYQRHSTAALLNAANTEVGLYFTTDQIILWAASCYGHWMMEDIKDLFEGWNETGCPLN